jgi:TetR/AcrR family tetracycline transcriptional repressor
MLNTKRIQGKHADLTPDQIVAAAFKVLDTHGFDALTMRAIASHLRVQNPALYWHFADKQTLVNAMAAAMLAVAEADFSALPWDTALAESARRFRRVLSSHKDGARVVAAADLAQSPLHSAQHRAIAQLGAAGCGQRESVVAVVALYDFVLGSTFEEQADPRPRRGAAAMFEEGLEIFLDGLRLRLRRRGRRDPVPPRTSARRAKPGSRGRGAG